MEDSTKSTFNWRCEKILDDLVSLPFMSQQKKEQARSIIAVDQELQNTLYYNVFDRYK